MSIEVKHVQNVAVIYPKGEITIGNGDLALQSKVRDLLDEGHHNIVANLKDVGFIDSSGMGILMGLFGNVSGEGGDFKLCALSSNLSRLLQVDRLESVFEIFYTEQEAVDSF